jgi:hypothetical protein
LGAPEDYEYNVAIAAEFGVRACHVCGSEFIWPRPSVRPLRSFARCTLIRTESPRVCRRLILVLTS